MPNPTLTKLDESNSERYRSKPGRPKEAKLRWERASYSLCWGEQNFDGPHMVVTHDGEEYGVDLRAFFATHRAVPELPHHYIKDAIVRATQVDEPTEVVTVVDGRKEMRATVEPGAWVIQNPGGELYYNSDEKFREAYEPLEGEG